MQNYNNPPQPPHAPQGGYGRPPQPPAKKGMSTGLKVLIVALVLVVGGGVLVVALAVGGIFYFSRSAQEAASASRPGLTGLTDAGSGGGEAGPPSPTAEQQAAIAGGQSAAWEQQEISWTVPQKWKKFSADSTTLLWRSPGSWDAASLIVNISPMDASFPSEISLKSYYDTYTKDKQKYAEVRWLRLGGVKGVMFRESSPES